VPAPARPGSEGRDAHAATGGPSEPAPSGRRGADNGQAAPAVLEPLPSREEFERQLAEEAAEKDAEIRNQQANREAATHLKRQENRVKFRQELREILNIHGAQAGPEIDKLSHKYGFDTHAELYARAFNMWHNAPISQEQKVRQIRSLDLPESVILDFLCSSMHTLIRTRGGPRDEMEVRVRAARRLLSYELPKDDPTPRPDGRAGPGATPARVPAPRGNGAGSRP
jgi:hypothetical protein